MLNNLINYTDLVKNNIYYLTGEYWHYSDCLHNEPVKFLYFLDDKGNKIKNVGKKRNCNAICKIINSDIKSVTGLVEVHGFLYKRKEV